MEKHEFEKIACWVIDYLKLNGKTSDSTLHWDACKNFLSRDQIISAGTALDNFSEGYDEVLINLEKELYLYSREGDYWIADKRENDLKNVVFAKNTKDKIKCFYIVEFKHGCKIGITTQFKTRVRDYLKPWCVPVKSIDILQNADPLEVEDHLKKSFKKDSVGGTEFVAISKNKIKREVEAKFQGSVFEKYYI